MVGGFSLVLAAALVSTTPSSRGPERSQCDEKLLSLTADDAVDTDEPEDRDDAETLLGLGSTDDDAARDDEATTGTCESARNAPAVIDCHDPRMSIWVGQMVGTCDAPRGVAPPMVRGAPSRRSSVCNGIDCAMGGPSPLTAFVRQGEPPYPLLSAPLRILVTFDSVRLPSTEMRLPASTTPARLERPPRPASRS